MDLRYFTLALLLLCPLFAFSQYPQYTASATSSQGWSIAVTIEYDGIKRTSGSNNCAYGFNYELRYKYTVNYSDGGGNRMWYLAAGGGCFSGGSAGLTGSSGTLYSPGKYSNSSMACNAIDPASFECYDFDIIFNGPGIPSSSSRMKLTPASVVLPVELVTFTAEKSGNAVALAWATASEEDNSYFGVERSQDGKTWEPIASLPGKGMNFDLNTYQFTDAYPHPGTNYYRLAQTDFDGTVTLSEVTLVTMPSQGIVLFPNPASDYLTVEAEGDIHLFDGQGQSVPLNGIDVTAGSGIHKLNVSGLHPGIYYIKAGNNVSRFLHP
ncbi:putative secreted protein (Por secretion system target) [Neolewinella xylanilytica]|uniref:Putative secreted protein (Por secretion system target) n=1 Tax=Neolewinella xylanilytica TaxID=1514080 RepID=A0A2S6I0X5_9BACT|nr:T9SS type A sorting domain-containing protein [Neolewinella xylanilytica]PPK84627.1 putative secreted protein (Por secretion system target) [Neolewinella xylanilytica]